MRAISVIFLHINVIARNVSIYFRLFFTALIAAIVPFMIRAGHPTALKLLNVTDDVAQSNELKLVVGQSMPSGLLFASNEIFIQWRRGAFTVLI